MRRFAKFCLLAAALSLTGAGCLKSRQQVVRPPAPVATTQTTSTKPSYPTFPSKKPTRTAKDDLIEVLKNFADAKSFRAKAHSNAGASAMNATMEFIKPSRFHGRLQQSGSVSSTELIVVDDSLFLKIDNTVWVDLSKSQGSKTLGDAMFAAFSKNTDLQQFLATDDTTVDVTEDNARSCTLFTVHRMVSGKDQPTGICVENGLPKYIDKSTDGNTNTVEYYDYNATFSILKPI